MATELKPEIKDGMSQSERYLSSLDPAYFRIDEKDTNELLKLLADLSGQFNYYNFSNQIEGDWRDFLTSDIDILMSLLSRLDSRSITDAYKKLTDKLLLAENEKQLTRSLKHIFQFILDFAITQSNYHHQFMMAGNLGHAHHFEAAQQTCMHNLQKLYSYNQSAEAILGDEILIAFDHPSLRFLHQENFDVIEEPFTNGANHYEKVMQSIPYFDALVNDLNTRYAALLNISGQYVKKQSLDGDLYDPQVALMLSFLHLYSYLQRPVNQLMQKHLDYFYHDIIGIKRKKERLDNVHLVIEPASLTSPVWLKKGEQIYAEIAGEREKLQYTLANNVLLSSAQIKEIKTLFVSKKSQVRSKQSKTEDVRELRVYKGDYPAPLPGDLQKDHAALRPWPLLGEEQSELSIQHKTMAKADYGLLVASPLFYQTDGRRTFHLKFFIQRQSFAQFIAHVTKLSNATAISTAVLVSEMLNQSFLISITGALEWISIEKYAVSYAEGPDPFIEINFRMAESDAPASLYNPEIHGDHYDTKWPVVRLMLNNLSFHHPYTFLSYFIIERITVKVQVNDSTRFKLKNNMGELFGGAPFQPFGPQPSNGTYLDIKSNNIFNRYTTNFRLKLQWLDLPQDDQGFGDYYSGYNYPFPTDGFKVLMNSSADAKTFVETEEKQEFQLFETTAAHGKGRLKTATTINGINFKKIKFDNPLSMDQEESPLFIKQGTIRLEFKGSQEAFGHRLYQKAFTETVTHNARMFARQRALPNMPYTPLVKSLSVDYILEHSEVTSGSSSASEEVMMMFHVHPFGHNRFYTGKNSVPNYFIAPKDQESNLFIGLSGLIPSQELSLLFQLSEENFHHAVHEPEKVSWSHLIDNEWVILPKSAVLQDTTSSFVNSGIVTLKIPDRIVKGNTILNPDLYWIRASLAGESSLSAKVTALFPQAALAVRVPDQATFPDHTYLLPAGAIKGFNAKVDGVSALYQFFPSTGGLPQETEKQYKVRVSERLRHKNRLLSILDISQAILDVFPQILMVKCYHTDNNNSQLPGIDLHVIVIPKEHEDGTFYSQEPKVSLAVLYQIKKFINASVSDFVQIEVGNPVYEKIMVRASVKFNSENQGERSDGYYLKLMNEDIRQYISAWMYGTQNDFQIGKKIFVSEILNYLQNKKYINYITGFSLLHFYKTWNKEEENYHAQVTDTAVDQTISISGSVPGAILVAAEENLLTLLEEARPGIARMSGIGQFSIGGNLLTKPAKDELQAEDEPAPASPDEYYDFTIYTH